MKNPLKYLLIFTLLLLSAHQAEAQNTGFCQEIKTADFKKIQNIFSRLEVEKLSDPDAVKIMKCLLNQEGNKTQYWGVTFGNNVSQTFGPSPFEVVALFYVSYIFKKDKNFASAMVLIEDDNDEKFNPPGAVKAAYRAYRQWFKKIEQNGLKAARKNNVDPLGETKVSWY